MNYWKDRVIQDFLPPINETRKRNVNGTDKSNTHEAPSVSKVVEYKMVKTIAHMQKNKADIKAKYPSSSEEYEDLDDGE